MNIADVQKRKFLYNIYKNYYSTGIKPSDFELKKAFNQYFSYNELGEPVKLDINRLQSTNVVDHHILNELMVNTLLNLEVLYDCVMENNEQIFSTITVLNNKLDNLRSKRKEIESKIDQLIFSNSNSDGFFYSYLENFSNTSMIDLDKTSAFVDLVNNNVSIPKITSEFSNQVSNKSLVVSSVSGVVTVNSSVVFGPTTLNGFDAVFDGLNDTYWTHDHFADMPGVVSMTFDVPVTVGYTISKVEGSIISQTPCSIFLKANSSSTGSATEIIRTQESRGDYNRFSFVIPNDFYSTISITLVKSEPDKILNIQSSPYVYSFGFRELTIGSSYYDERAQLVSQPISIPSSDNSLLTIESVSLDAKYQTIPGTSLSFYVAPNVEGASSINDFNWTQIEPSTSDVDAISNVVNLVSSNKMTEVIDNASEAGGFDYELIPVLNADTTNANESNPFRIPFSDRYAYKVAKLNSQISYKSPVLLGSVDNFNSYWISGDSSKFSTSLGSTLNSWAALINDDANVDIRKTVFTNYSSIFDSAFPGPSAELMETRLMCEEAKTVSHLLSKGNGLFDLYIYLNGSLIGEVLANQSTSRIEWNFVKGINTISVAYDNQSDFKINFDLMVGANLFDYGTVFLDYFTYLDSIEFRRRTDLNTNAFTVDNVYGVKFLLASKGVLKKSILRYYSDSLKPVDSVRYRVDLNRFANPLQTPVISSMRIKFKHNDS